MSPSYPFRATPLTSGIAIKVIPEMYNDGYTVSRAVIIREITPFHIERGGLESRGSVTSLVKKALSELVKTGAAEVVTKGYYRISHTALSTPGAGAEEPAAEEDPVEYGEGPESVYAYYFPAYKDQAAYLGNQTWPLKIGHTAGEPSHRVREQIGTAMPELPIVGLIYRCSDSRALEKAIHSTLTTKGKRLKDAPGKEWFDTSLDEVRVIIEFAS